MKKKKILDPTWKDYFTFTRRERKGIHVFIALLIVQLSVLFYLHHYSGTRATSGISEFLAEGDRWLLAVSDTVNPNTDSVFHVNSQGRSVKPPSPSRFAFDPNSINEKEWMRLGFSEKQSRSIRHFVEKGARFRVKEDLKKLFCMKPEHYSQLEPWIQLPDSATSKILTEKKWKQKKVTLQIDLCTSDSATLVRLPGIGPGFAHRISAYRDKLGGFYSLDQLKEVWGFSDSLFEAILPFLFLSDSTVLQPLHLNSASEDLLKTHPYIGFKLARLLVRYRDQHGPFHTEDEVLKVPLFTAENFRKLAPYLRFD